MRFKPDQTVGRFRIEEVAAAGGFSVVYRAYDQRLDHDVAIKVLADNLAMDIDQRSRFADEALAMRKVNSPDVATIFDVGETDDGQPYLVMSYADRGTLADRLASGRSITADDVAEISRFLANALGAMHRSRLIHRDVKPSNVLITSGGPTRSGDRLLQSGDRLLLADLGLVKDLSQGSGMTVGTGTRGYSAPEQWSAGQMVDERTDIYGASALVADIATGRLGDGPDEWQRVLSAPSFGALGPVLTRGLARDPDDRHRSVGDWITAVERALTEKAPAQRRSPLRAGLIAVGCAAVLALATWIYVGGRDRVEDASGSPSSLTSTEGTAIVTETVIENDFGRSPDPDSGVTPLVVAKLAPPTDVLAEVEGQTVSLSWIDSDDGGGVNIFVTADGRRRWLDWVPVGRERYDFFRLPAESGVMLELQAVDIETKDESPMVGLTVMTGETDPPLDPVAGAELRSFRSDLCVSILEDGAVQMPCADADAANRFLFESDDESSVSIRSVGQDRCLGLPRTAGPTRRLVTVVSCDSASVARFTPVLVTGVHQLRLESDEVESRCLDVAGGSEESGAELVVFPCTEASNQRWRIPGL